MVVLGRRHESVSQSRVGAGAAAEWLAAEEDDAGQSCRQLTKGQDYEKEGVNGRRRRRLLRRSGDGGIGISGSSTAAA